MNFMNLNKIFFFVKFEHENLKNRFAIAINKVLKAETSQVRNPEILLFIPTFCLAFRKIYSRSFCKQQNIFVNQIYFYLNELKNKNKFKLSEKPFNVTRHCVLFLFFLPFKWHYWSECLQIIIYHFHFYWEIFSDYKCL